MDLGVFSWPEFVNTALPIYLTAFATFCLVYVAWKQATEARKEAARRASREILENEFHIENHQFLPNLVKKYDHDLSVLLPQSMSTPLDEILDESLSEERNQDREKLINFISRRELLANNLRSGGIDESEIYQMIGSKLVWEWSVLNPFINIMREKTAIPTYFIEYERLAKTWSLPSKRK